MRLEQLTGWLWSLRTDLVQAYAVWEGDGFCLIDTSTAGNETIILELLGGIVGCGPEEVTIHEIFLTHGHIDHTGSAAALVDRTGARVIAPIGDAPVIRAERSAPPPRLADWEKPLFDQAMPGVPLEQRLAPAAAVIPDRLVEDGDTLDWKHSARLLGVPGHTPGSTAAWFERERVLVAGDAIASHEGRPILGVFNTDPPGARDSFRRLARLNAEVACFGHGDAVRSDAGARLAEVAQAM
ncbi:MAG TPA: MBL fold metallo-hydrolase [Solirubrobacteraceae bacterium]|nr:MBL fold metallo-hydrolase [Solirubrobacteraceae bacterium]